MEVNLMTKCLPCGNNIAQSAESCPACGAKNAYVHPKIAAFDGHKLQKTPEFKYESLRLQVGGTTEGKRLKLERTGWALALGALAVMFFINVALGIITMLVGYWLIWGIAPRYGLIDKAFWVDFQSGVPVWQSNDDAFWSEVKKFFMS